MTTEVQPKPTFDHCYKSIEDDEAYKRFEGRGFILNPDPVIHPGRLKCQFLHFLSPAGALVYLEFLFKDETLPQQSDKPEEPMTHAGFAMRVGKDLRHVFDHYQKDYPGLRPKFEHRNYAIEADETLKLPGWNFLSFENPPVEDIEVWLIEYEPIPTRTEDDLKYLRQKFMRMVEHPNSARRILGFLWKAGGVDKFKSFAALSGSIVVEQKLSLEGGTTIRFIQDADPLFGSFSEKKNTFLAVVIGVDSLEKFTELAKPDDFLDVFGKQAARIRLGELSWDIIAIEGNAF